LDGDRPSSFSRYKTALAEHVTIATMNQPEPIAISSTDLTQFLDTFFAVDSVNLADDPQGIYQSGTRPICRLGLALEPTPELSQWIKDEQLDALFLHRPWSLEPGQIDAEISIISYHLAFDQHLTLGFNPRLAIALTLNPFEPLGQKNDRTIGMIGTIPEQSGDRYIQQLHDVFSGLEEVQHGSASSISKVAVMGAMTDALVREAADRGAELYITGQFRHPAKLAVEETGISVAIVGHHRSEVWGLRTLSHILQERWSDLTVICLT
jgi:putative NIF3 family GTP cyclohydrolase 1 type 2